MDGKELIVCANGEYLPRSKARIDPFDFGWRRGWVVFDAAAVWKGYFFKLDRHVERLWNSMLAAKIEPPMNKQGIKEVFIETVRRNGLKDAECLFYVSYGVPTAADNPFDCPKKTTFVAIAFPYYWFGGIEAQKVGIRVIISSVRSLPPQCVSPRMKHINRLNINLADAEAQAANVDAPILLDIDGYIADNNACNVFLAKDGKLYTPSEEGVLGGITKETVFEIAQREGIPFSGTNLSSYHLYTADEVFFSSTAGGIIPVVEISGRKIGDGKPGSLTKRLNKIYFEMHERGEYGTPVYP